MPTFTWTAYSNTDFMEYYQEGCNIPAYKDWGYLYYNPLYAYDFTQPIDPVTGLQPPSANGSCNFDVNNGSVMYEAWHRQTRSSTTCYKCDQRMTIAQFNQLPYLGDGSSLDYPVLPPIPDPGPPPP